MRAVMERLGEVSAENEALLVALKATLDLCNAMREYAPTLNLAAERELRNALRLVKTRNTRGRTAEDKAWAEKQPAYWEDPAVLQSDDEVVSGAARAVALGARRNKSADDPECEGSDDRTDSVREIVPPEDAWFYTPEWQETHRQALAELDESSDKDENDGRTKTGEI